jgi:hypothetical protein
MTRFIHNLYVWLYSERNILVPNSSAFSLFAMSLQGKTKLILRVHAHWCFKFCTNNLSHLGYRLRERTFYWRLIEEIHWNQIWRPRITWCCVDPTSSAFCFLRFKMLVAGLRNKDWYKIRWIRKNLEGSDRYKILPNIWRDRKKPRTLKVW